MKVCLAHKDVKGRAGGRDCDRAGRLVVRQGAEVRPAVRVCREAGGLHFPVERRLEVEFFNLPQPQRQYLCVRHVKPPVSRECQRW